MFLWFLLQSLISSDVSVFKCEKDSYRGYRVIDRDRKRCCLQDLTGTTRKCVFYSIPQYQS